MMSTFILPFSFNDFPVYSHEILSLRQRQVWLPPLSGLRPMAQVAWRAATQAASAPVFLRSTVCSLALNMKKSWSHENNKAFSDLGGWLCHTLKVSSAYCKRATDAIYYYILLYHTTIYYQWDRFRDILVESPCVNLRKPGTSWQDALSARARKAHTRLAQA